MNYVVGKEYLDDENTKYTCINVTDEYANFRADGVYKSFSKKLTKKSNVSDNTKTASSLFAKGVTSDSLKHMKNLKHLIKGFLVQQHHTILFGGSGTQKSTLACHFAIKIAKKHKMKVYYFGFDISLPNVVGFKRLIDDKNLTNDIALITDITAVDLIDYFDSFIASAEDLNGVVFIIDTFKFVSADINNKNANKEILHKIKELQKLGATILSLAHSNKDGVKQSGTAEIEQDSDAIFKITREVDDMSKIATVSIEKGGRVRFETHDMSFTIPLKGKDSDFWYQSIKGVKKADYIDLESQKDEDVKKIKFFNTYKPELKVLIKYLWNGLKNQSDIVDYMKDHGSRNTILKVLKEGVVHGIFMSEQKVKEHNALFYELDKLGVEHNSYLLS